MLIVLNGNEKEFEDGLTIFQVLQQLDLHPQRVAVEVNREIVKRDRFTEHLLQDGDVVEILQFVGGG